MNASKLLAAMLCASGVLAADTKPLPIAEGFAAPEAKPRRR